MIDRTLARFGLYPEALVADTAYGSADMLGWLVHEHGIELHIPVFDKSERRDGTFSNTDFRFDRYAEYICPGGNGLKKYWRTMTKARTGICKDGFICYYASKKDCSRCALKVPPMHTQSAGAEDRPPHPRRRSQFRP